MNKKSRIKTTLDSLFTGGKISSEETKAKDVKPVERAKPLRQDVKKELPGQKTTEVNPLPPPAKSVSDVTEVIQQPEHVEMTVKENIVEPPLEKPTIPQSKPEEIKPPAMVLEKKKSPVEQIQASDREKNQAAVSRGGEEEHLVIFTLGKELYGVTIHSVESIIKLQAITEVPRTASYILGVTNLRGTVVPVLDLRKRFNLLSSENSSNTRIVIVNAEGAKVGIVVDEVTEVLKVSRDAIQPPPPMSTTIESAFINGIARINDRLVILLDLEKVLASSIHQPSR